ncbi:MAG: cobalamin B12-binding domain-containing protein, partial [Deltaproteobacteria bacterium]|nr:cobalamin B12-binding domain-containing protein [Deltaproteobacteria bacterium]
MNILLVNSPVRLDARPNCIPYGLATVAAVLRNEGHKVTLYDANALRPTREELLRDLGRIQWDIAGVSGLVTTFSFQVWIIERLKAMNPQAPVVSGGGL